MHACGSLQIYGGMVSLQHHPKRNIFVVFMCTITVALALARTFSLIFKVSVILLQHYCGHSYSHPPRLPQTRYIGYLIHPPDHSHQTFAAHARSMLNASQRLQLTEVCVEGLKDSKVMMLSLLFALSIILNVVIFFPSPM